MKIGGIVNKLRTGIGMVAVGLLVLALGAFPQITLPSWAKIVGAVALGIGAILILIGKNKI